MDELIIVEIPLPPPPQAVVYACLQCRLLFAGVAFGLVLLFTFLRHRLPRWPLHPVMLLMLGSWPALSLGPSFLAGWVVKALVTRYAGESGYRNLKPFMTGLIAGEILAGVLIMLIGAAVYLATGQHPKMLRLLPG